MFDIVTLGAATLDVFLKSTKFSLNDGSLDILNAGAKSDVEEAAVATGGAATNTAVGFARMGFSVACICEVGTDFAGDVVLQDLKQEGVDTSLTISERSEQTAVAALLIAQDGGRTALVYRGASRMITTDDIDWNTLQTKWMHLSTVGNIDLIARAMSFCKQRGVKLSWNPGNWEIERIASGELKPDWSAVEVLCVNREEMEKLTGLDLTTDGVWNGNWSFIGPKIVVVTDGKQGGKYFAEGRLKTYTIEPGKTIQETGAGDAFITGFLCGQLSGRIVEDCIELGKKSAASVVQHMGAKKGLPRKS